MYYYNCPLRYVVRDLGVLFDSELTMKKHIAKVAAVCFFHIRRLRQIAAVSAKT